VAHIYNPSFLGSRDDRVIAPSQPRQKVSKILNQKITDVLFRPIITVTLEARIEVGGPVQKQETLFENKLKQKRLGDMTQMVECLPSKPKSLTSTPHREQGSYH
jgi:hypothetical protein